MMRLNKLVVTRITLRFMWSFIKETCYSRLLIIQSKRIKASKEWPPITAQVVQKEVVRHRSSKGHVSYIPEVSYKYSVMGSEFPQRTRLGGTYSSLSAEKALNEINFDPEKFHGRYKTSLIAMQEVF